MTPFRRHWRTNTRDVPKPTRRQLAVVLLCCLALGIVFGPIPGAAAFVGYAGAQALTFGALVLFTLGQVRGRRTR